MRIRDVSLGGNLVRSAGVSLAIEGQTKLMKWAFGCMDLGGVNVACGCKKKRDEGKISDQTKDKDLSRVLRAMLCTN